MAKVGPKMAKVGPKMAKDGPKLATVGHLGRPAVRRSEISTYVTVSMLFRPRWPRWPPLPLPASWAVRTEGAGTRQQLSRRKLRQEIKGIDKKAEPPAPRKNNGLSGDDAA